MPPINLLIKPASGNCNLRCRYCFYADITQNREIESFGMMSLETLEIIVEKALKKASGNCTFAFQGGEPTLAGLDFYRKLMQLEKKYNVKNIEIHNSIQTNGYVIDDEWAKFFADNKFLVGLSLDGDKTVNDSLRLDATGQGVYKTIMRTANIFNKYKVEYNILTVVTAQLVKDIGRVYGFYKRNKFQYQQYIPCLDPIGEKRGAQDYSLTPELYGRFLKNLFDLWYNDIRRGEFVYNRYFENLVGMIKGYPPESCGMRGHCTFQNVIEADGSVYPCDFYVLDCYNIGNLITDSFEQIETKRKEIGFVEKSIKVEQKCLECRWKNLCRGGCRRDRDYVNDNGDIFIGQNYFCKAYEEFFEYAIDRLMLAANVNV